MYCKPRYLHLITISKKYLNKVGVEIVVSKLAQEIIKCFIVASRKRLTKFNCTKHVKSTSLQNICSTILVYVNGGKMKLPTCKYGEIPCKETQSQYM